jgi:5-methylthioadenosine/S-adenosylhomocysteine deaminase
VVKNLVYSGNPGNVRLTMIAGKVLYENGTFFVGEDIETVYRQAQKYTKQIVEE